MIAVALAAGFVTWIAVRSSSSGGPPAPATVTAASQPRVVSSADLRSTAATLGHPLYWVGPRLGNRYELTKSAGGNVYVRYLPPNVRAGDRRADFLAVGTYPVRNPFAQTRAAGRRHGAVTLKLPGGGIAVYDRARPTSVYFAYPGSNVQVEVYSPRSQEARTLVLAGQVVPVG